MPLKTLFLNPPSFENFDGGAGSRWPATREIESYWYPVWLAYPAGMLEGARLLDAPPHKVSGDETIEIAKEYEFLVLFTSTPGFPGDILLAGAIKRANAKIKIAFVGPHVSVLPEKSLRDCPEIDFVCRKEFDYQVVDFAKGKPDPDAYAVVIGVEKYRQQGIPAVDYASRDAKTVYAYLTQAIVSTTMAVAMSVLIHARDRKRWSAGR